MNKALHIGLSVLTALILAAVIIKPSIADSAILLEQQRPNYWNYLATARTEYGEVLHSTAEIENRRNFIVNSLGVIEGDGYILRANEDGTISFEGRNNGGNASYLFCTLDVLPDGEYVYDDGVEIPGITSYLEGVNYLIGGGEERERFNGSFAHEYSRYECKVEIDSGFEGDVVIYPMLKIATDTDESYEPCLTKGIEVSDPVGYNMVWVSRDDLLHIDNDDLIHYLRNVRGSQSNLSWVTICFGDGTGLCNSITDLEHVSYGMTNDTGVVIDKIDVVRTEMALSQIQFINEKDIRCIDGFLDYLDYLTQHDYTIILSAKDDYTASLNNNAKNKLRKLGLEAFLKDLRNDFRNSYIAIIKDGEVRYELSSKESLEYSNVLPDGTNIEILSKGYLVGNHSSIVINGKEESMNRIGMNIVVVDNNTIIDTVAFNTHSDWKAYRQ